MPTAGQDYIMSLSGITQRTPRRKSPKPSSEDMHPQLHKPSTATPYDEARWLQFFKGSPKTGPKTEPYQPRVALKDFPESPTPSKVSSMAAALSSPAYPFTFGGAAISPTARKELEDTKLEASKILKQMREQKTKLEESTARKIAKPKGRFSNAHNSAFMKMDSIANHASAWRANPSRAQPSLKRVASKIELDRPTASSALKRSPSKAELDGPETPRYLKRSPSKISLVESGDKDSSTIQEPSAKRVKRDIKPPGNYASPVVRTPSFKKPGATPRTLPGAKPTVGAGATPSSSFGHRSNLLSPTAASLARSRSTHDLLNRRGGRGNSRIPALPPRAPSAVDLLCAASSTPPRRQALAARTSPLTPLGRTTPVIAKPVPMPPLGRIATTMAKHPSLAPPKSSRDTTPVTGSITALPKSILRSPTRLYSTDPSKIAAGTHLATPTPPRVSAASRLPVAAAEPASERAGGGRAKHVDFTASARLKALRDEARAAAATPAQTAPYPDLSTRADEAVAEAACGDFTFRASGGTGIVFAGASTIRAVRDDDAGDGGAAPRAVAGVKRKMSAGSGSHGGDGEGKENDAEGGGEERPAKKMRRGTGPGLSETGAGGRRAAARAAGKRILTAARLNYLARPKRAA
jgi:hypothetical protein